MASAAVLIPSGIAPTVSMLYRVYAHKNGWVRLQVLTYAFPLSTYDMRFSSVLPEHG
jgi:hypothetical protein